MKLLVQVKAIGKVSNEPQSIFVQEKESESVCDGKYDSTPDGNLFIG